MIRFMLLEINMSKIRLDQNKYKYDFNIRHNLSRTIVISFF